MRASLGALTIVCVGLFGTAGILTVPAVASAPDEFTVYSVYQGIDMGEPAERPQRDYYVSMGERHGLKLGTQLKVLRKTASYNLITKAFQADMAFPIAVVRVIHVERNTAIARLVKLLPADDTPSAIPQSIMVGDLVRPPER